MCIFMGNAKDINNTNTLLFHELLFHAGMPRHHFLGDANLYCNLGSLIDPTQTPFRTWSSFFFFFPVAYKLMSLIYIKFIVITKNQKLISLSTYFNI